MDAFGELEAAWIGVRERFMASAPLRRLAAGDIGIGHYVAYLRETYFYTREDPQLQAAATIRFRGNDRRMVRPFLRHALSEVGHDRLALNDLAALGFRTDAIPDEEPLPATMAMTAFAFYAIGHRTPVSYLGWLYFLEFLPTSSGEVIGAALARAGVPAAAMTFLQEHRQADVEHNRMMRGYAEHMLRGPGDIGEVIEMMRVTAALYVTMLDGAFAAADEGRLPERLPARVVAGAVAA